MPADVRPQVNIRLSVEQRDELLKRAGAEGLTPSALVQRAIDRYLAGGPQTDERRMATLGRRVVKLVESATDD